MRPRNAPGLSLSPHTGVWYRAIQPQFWTTSLSTSHTQTFPSRFNQGPTANPQFEILYLAENPMVALFEVQSLLGSPMHPGGVIPNPRQAWIIINVQVVLLNIADLTDPQALTTLEASEQDTTGDWRGFQQRSLLPAPQTAAYAPTQDLGAVLFNNTNADAFMTWSAKVPYHKNLVVFPQKLIHGSSRVVFVHPQTGVSITIP